MSVVQPDKYDEGEVVLFPVADVIVDREARQRSTLDKDIKTLAEQIAGVGRLIHPITLHREPYGKLVAGERRLEAHKLLGWTRIRAQFFEDLPFHQAYLIELLENVARRNLTWQDEVLSVSKYHKMRLQQSAGMWTVKATATDMDWSETSVRRYLTIADHLGDEEVAGAQTLEGAFNLIKGRAERASAAASNRGIEIASAMPLISSAASPEARSDAIRDLLKKGGLDARPDPAASSDFALIEAGAVAVESLRRAAENEEKATTSPIITGSFIEWAPAYDGPAFDVLHVDFPYGKDYKGSNTRRTGRAHVAPTYADSEDIMWELVECLLTWQDKLAYPIAHLIFWFDMEFYDGVKTSFTNAGWRLVQPHPLIWFKPAQGVAADPKRRPRHVYETALLFSRGDRKLAHLEQDVFAGRKEESLHINQKSEEMLEQFLRLVVDEHTAVFDPTCGSGSALAVAKRLGAQRILGVEIDEENANVARHVIARGEKA